MFISGKKEMILRYLAEYKYLCVSHFIKLGLTESIDVCRRDLRELRTKFKFVEKMTVASISESMKGRLNAKKIRQEDVHYLTIKGARFLEEQARIRRGELRFPKRIKTALSNDYFHRVSSISVHVSYNQWIEKNGFDHYETLLYYDKRSKFKGLKSKIESCIILKDGRTKTPDLVMGYKNRAGEGKIFIFELYNGARPKYILDETKELIKALQENSELSERIGIKKAPRILITCETDQQVKKIMGRIKEDSFFNFKQIDKLLLFNTDRRVWSDFGNNWVNLFGEVVNLQDL